MPHKHKLPERYSPVKKEPHIIDNMRDTPENLSMAMVTLPPRHIKDDSGEESQYYPSWRGRSPETVGRRMIRNNPVTGFNSDGRMLTDANEVQSAGPSLSELEHENKISMMLPEKLILNEHQVGFHPTNIGFPHLGDCMAIVLHRTEGLYGFHFTPGNEMQLLAFKAYIDKSSLSKNGTNIELYGSVRRGRRWPGEKSVKIKWQDEMKKIADLIDYKGKVSGFDLSSTSHGPSDKSRDETIYAEYVIDKKENHVYLQYKRMSKMEVIPASNGVTGEQYGIQRVTPIGPWGSGGYELKKPSHSISFDVIINKNKAKSAEGKMHYLRKSKAESFIHLNHPCNPGDSTL